MLRGRHESNELPEYYRARGDQLVSDQLYMLHILSYVKAGRFKGLNNALLRELGGRLTFYDGLPAFFQTLKEHGRVQSVGPADYTPGSQTYLWLTAAVDEIARRIVATRRASIEQRVGRPPTHRSPRVQPADRTAPDGCHQPAAVHHRA